MLRAGAMLRRIGILAGASLLMLSGNAFLYNNASAVKDPGQAAFDVAGQTDQAGVKDFSSRILNNPRNVGVNTPNGIAIDSVRHKAYIADTGNNRVLVHTLRSDNTFIDYQAEYVIGQNNFSSVASNKGGSALSSSSLSSPSAVAVDESDGTLYIADTGNNRVLVFSTVGANNPDASYVIGANEFTLNNATGVVSPARMYSPSGIALYGSGASLKIYIADKDFNRVLQFDRITSNGQSAVRVLGQSNFITSGTGLSQSTFANPTDVATGHDGKLYVVDSANNRVMVWADAITENGQAASMVLGQAWFYSNNSGTSSSSINRPQSVSIDGSGAVYLSDTGNNRVMIWTSPISLSNQRADVVLGQAGMNTSTRGAGPVLLSSPGAVAVKGQYIYVADTLNHRVTVYNKESASGQSAVAVIGQLTDDGVVDFYGNVENNPQASGMHRPGGVAIDTAGHRLFVGDSMNNRVLIYNLNAANELIDTTADAVLGQDSFSVNAVNRGGSPSAHTLNNPSDVFFDSVSRRLYIADTGNNRVLIFNREIESNGQAADVVIGQDNFTNSSPSLSRTGLASPEAVSVNTGNGMVAVADRDNNRILVWNAAPTSNNTPASYVLGHGGFASSASGASDSALNNPQGVAFDGITGYLYVADTNNNRILVWNAAITNNGQAASYVLGQPSMTSRAEGVSDISMNKPTKVNVGATSSVISVSDTANNRVLLYKKAILGNGQAADTVVGQVDMTSATPQTSAVSLRSPGAAVINPTSGVLIVADRENNRLMLYANDIPLQPSGTIAVDPAEAVRGNPTFHFTGSDPDGDALQYRIEIARDSAFTTSVIQYDQTLSSTGWSGQTIGNAYGLDAIAAFTVPDEDALLADTTYYWRVFAFDPFGVKQWSVSSDVYQFKTASPRAISFINTPLTSTAGYYSSPMTIGLHDGEGNRIKSGTVTRVYLSSSSSGAVFSSDVQGAVEITYVDIPANSLGVDVYYKDTRVGRPTLTASDATPPDGPVGLIDGVYTLDINPSQVDRFEFSVDPNRVAGEPFILTVVAKDMYGNTVSDFHGDVDLSSTLEETHPKTISVSSGVWSGEMRLYKAGNVRIKSEHETIHGESAFFTVHPGALNSTQITPRDTTVKSGAQAEFSAASYDPYGNTIASSVTYSWSADGAIGSLGTTTGQTTVLTGAGAIGSGNISLTATRNGSVVADTTGVTVIADHFSIEGIGASIVAGEKKQVTITARSASGGAINNANDTVTLAESSGTVYPKEVTLSGGSWTGLISITKATQETSLAMETAGGRTKGKSDNFAVTAADIASVSVDPSAFSLSIGTKQAISGIAVDEYANIVNDVTYSWTTSIGSIPAQGSEVEFSAGTVSGTGTITAVAAKNGVTKSVLVPVTVHSATVDHFGFSIIGDQVAGQGFQITISARDQYGNTVTSFTGNGSIVYSGGTIAPSVTTDFSNGTWTGSVRVTKAASAATISFSSGALTGSSNTFIVRPAALTSVAISPSSVTMELDTTRQLTAEGYDSYGNVVQENIAYAWSVGDASMATIEIPSGSEVTLATKTKTGSTTIGVTATVGSTTQTTNLILTINHGPVDHFVFDTISSPQPTGELIGLKVVAKDKYGNTATSFADVVYLTDKTGSLSPLQTTSFSDGVWSGYVRIDNVYTNNTITATWSGSVSGVSNEFDVSSNVLDRVIVTPSSSDVSVGQAQAFSAQAYDAFGNAITGLTYHWSTTGGIGTVSPASGVATTLVAGSVIGTGTVRVSVAQGAITKQSSALVTVRSGALDHFAIAPIADSIAGTPSQVTITAKDQYGNTVTSFNSSAVLSDTLEGVVPKNTGPFTQGVWQGQVAFEKSGVNNLTVISGAVSSPSGTFTVRPGTLYKAAIEPESIRVVAGKTQTIIGYGQDRFGNTIEDVSYAWSIPSGAGSLSSTVTKEVTLNAAQRTGDATLSLVVSNGTTLVSASVDVSITADVVAQFTIAPINSPQMVGVAFQVAIAAADQYGNTVTSFNQPVTLSDGTGSISPVQTSNFVNGVWNGTVVITQTSDNNYLTVQSGSVRTQSNQFTVEAGAQQVFLTVASGSNQSGSVNNKLSSPLIVKAVDLYGNPVSDVEVAYTVESSPPESSGVAISPEVTTTDREGFARSELKLGNKMGSYVVNASIKGRSSVGVVFYASATAGLVSSVKVTPSTTTLLAGSSQLFTAQVFDGSGNQVGVATPQWAVVAGGGTISNEGVFIAGTSARVYTNTIAATVNGVTGYASVTVTNIPGLTANNREGAGVIDHITLTPLSSSLTAGESQGFSVGVYDRYNEEVKSSDVEYRWTAEGGSLNTNDTAGITFTAAERPTTGKVSVLVTQKNNQTTKSAEAVVTIKPHPAGYIRVDAPEEAITAGDEFTVSLTAYKGDGTIDTGFTGPVELSDSTETIKPKVTGSFKNGTWSGKLAVYTGEDVTIIKAAGQQRFGVSGNVKIVSKYATKKNEEGGFWGGIYNSIAQAGDAIANFFHSFINVSGNYPETTRNVAAAAVAIVGFAAAGIGFSKVVSSGVAAIGRNPYARRKIVISIVGALVVSILFAGLSFLVAGFIKVI